MQLLGARFILEAWAPCEHLEELVIQAELALEEHSDRVLDAAKCLVEAVCKTILVERGVEQQSDASFPSLIKLTCRELGISESIEGSSIRNLASGLGTAIQALAELRNSSGPLSHGKDATHQPLGDWHRYLVTRAAEAIALLLFEVHQGLPPDLRHTRNTYDEELVTNALIDANTRVDLDEDRHVIVLNQFLEFRPSRILYDYDREAWIEAMQELPDEQLPGPATEKEKE